MLKFKKIANPHKPTEQQLNKYTTFVRFPFRCAAPLLFLCFSITLLKPPVRPPYLFCVRTDSFRLEISHSPRCAPGENKRQH